MGNRVYARLSPDEAEKLDKVRGALKAPTYCRDAVMWFTALVERSLERMNREAVTGLLYSLLASFRPTRSRWERTMARRVIINLSAEEMMRVNLARGVKEGEDASIEGDEDNSEVMAQNTFAYLAVVAKVKYALGQQRVVPSLTELGAALNSADDKQEQHG